MRTALMLATEIDDEEIVEAITQAGQSQQASIKDEV